MTTANKKGIVRSINNIQRQLKKLNKQEERIRAQWNRGYQKHLKASLAYSDKTRLHTGIAVKLRKIIKSWPELSEELTQTRDQIRQAIVALQRELKNMEIELAKVVKQQEAEQNERDEIVRQAFLLNNAMVAVLETRNNYLSSHVYKYLYDEKGKLKSQVSFINSDQTKKVIALVNTITYIEPGMAEEAKKLINDFFHSINQRKLESSNIAIDQTTQALVDITQQLLVERTRFKVGPNLYKFLSLEINSKIFPELKKAQLLLSGGLRSEKTNSYVRLFVKNPTTGSWDQVRQK